ncbi:nucleoside triphosphate pyrophosphohydrolase [Geovibrio ferrireducens]|uniref:nucleoside triphosphate pyrophosphohydrolase n=1 Tax=Geovibrio ferrireducens TaxID=46201 RepID=UPI002246C54C|nr:nucleoside triphosphate pyrophosphohydrolase [Geovibrio ferrireducens]
MSINFDRLVETVRKLRSPEGCPWDREQNLYSIKEHFMEEAYELLDALDNKDTENIREELGDIIFHVVFHSVMAEDEEEFSLDDVLEEINSKLIRRHPHVFGNETVSGTEDVIVNWDKIKAEEKKNLSRSFFDGIPASFPSLRRAEKLQKKARKVGFDWPGLEDCMGKVREEFAEFEEAVSEGSREHIEHELGDVLFALVNVSRFLETNPDEALRKCNKRFTARFEYIGRKLAEKGLTYEDASLEEMDRLWDEAKAAENSI